MRALRRLVADRAGSTAAEFALVLPVMLAFLFGIVDGGRFLWAYNRAEKATQAGVRMAAVTAPVASGLAGEDYATGYGLTPGDIIPADKLSQVVCTGADECTCEGTCPPDLSADSAAFSRIVDRMRVIDPTITADNVEVVYQGSGLGFAGDPAGMDISPMITVRLTGVTFKSIATLALMDLPMPAFAATLTAEDLAGRTSN